MFLGSCFIAGLAFQGIYDVINSLAEGETYQLVVGNTGEGELCFFCSIIMSLLFSITLECHMLKEYCISDKLTCVPGAE